MVFKATNFPIISNKRKLKSHGGEICLEFGEACTASANEIAGTNCYK